MSDSDPADPDTADPVETRRFWAFWTTLPGIFTGVAAVLTAIVGLITLLNSLDADGNDAVSSASPSQAVASTTSSSQVVATTGSSALPGGVLVQGKLTMKSPDLADLEKGVVGSTISGGDLYLYCSGSCLLNAMSGQLATIEDAGNKSECVAALGSRQEQALDPSGLNEDETLCIQTGDGHIAALRILGLPGGGTGEFFFSYTLWR
jgi:hypothetical protein